MNADGVCISPNDVPGFAKDAYMPDSMKDENGKLTPTVMPQATTTR